ncbi:MAG TPA: coniferyl aldehyde dehydrogenase [Pseudomonadales bacterium]|nr:coniferyl aldehyde dehydrogenase [Pseudomonadales bacterium]
MNTDEMKRALDSQRAAFLADGFPAAPIRVDRLRRLYRMVGENQQAIMEVCSRDFGNRSLHQSQMGEILAVMQNCEHAIRNLKRWMKPEKRPVMFPLNLLGARARVEYVPKGVVGVLGTWNFPVYTALSPVAGIFAAGNRSLVKLSELNPATAALLQSLIAKTFAPEELVAVTGGPEVGAEFAALPLDHIIFTGGTGIGRHILQAAVQNLTPCTLELGGKSPVIVGRSYDTVKAAERIMSGKQLNQGQACLAPDYVFVANEQLDTFVNTAVSFYSGLFPTLINNSDFTSVINARHQQRVLNYISDARQKGATVHEINPAHEDFSQQPAGMHKVPMTLIVNPTDDMLCMQEELFGPVLCIKAYHDVKECIHYINTRPRPLGLYYFGEDAQEERMVLDHTISGGVTLNDVMLHTSCEDLPFGGVGFSGMGAYHGQDGFRTFSHARAVYKQTKLDIMKLSGMLPPYGEKCEKQLNNLTKVKL